MRVRYSGLARADVRDAKAFYRRESLNRPAAFAAALRHSLQRIREHPQIGPPFEMGTRRFVMDRFPYAIIYYLTVEGIFIVAVQHHKRDSKYWQDFLSDHS